MMELPFTVGEFLDLFVRYNRQIFPIQFIAYILGLFAVFVAWRKFRHGTRIIAGILGLFWVWNGVMYHMVFFSSINRAAVFFGFLFVLQGLLFIFSGVYLTRLQFEFNPRQATDWIGLGIIAYGMMIYPLLGVAFGHVYPAAPVFGVAPCPTTIFTFGLLIWSTNRLPKWLLVIPVLWAVIGTSAALNLGVYEDFGLPLAAVISLAAILLTERKMGSAVGKATV